MNENEDVLRDALAGIKTKRTRKIISRFNAQEGLLFDIKEGKTYIEGQGIVHVQDVKEIILDCGHSARIGLGHIAECGHTVCALCIERFVLECAEMSCFKKLCTVPKCKCSARDVDGVFFCKNHYFWACFDSFGSCLFLGKVGNEERIRAILSEYYSRRLQLRARNEAERKREPSK